MPDRRPASTYQEVPESRSRGPGVTFRARRFLLPVPMSRRLALATLFATLVLISAAAIPAVAALPIVQASSPAAPAVPGALASLPDSAVSGAVPWRAAGGYQLSDGEIYKAALVAEAQRQAEAQALIDYAAALRAQEKAAEAAAPVSRDTSVYGINGSYVIANATITFYSCTGEGFCGNMANGQPVHEGAAACSDNLPLGTALRVLSDPSGRVLVCMDRGLLSPTWIDVFFYSAADGWAWQSVTGTVSDIEILR